MKTKTTRICSGIYDVRVGGRLFDVERYPDGAWLLFEVINNQRAFCNDFVTKADAVAAAVLCAGEVA